MNFDYLILGGGAAGLSLAHLMIKDRYFDNKSIGIIEPQSHRSNDRTWCFWDKNASPYDDIIYKNWSTIKFKSSTLDRRLSIYPYRYKMIRGLDFYNHVIPELQAAHNLTWIQDQVIDMSEADDHVTVSGQRGSYRGQLVFKSYVDTEINKDDNIYVDQHFKGWFIETSEDAFDETMATFMDFSIDQSGEVRFMYVLPESRRKALVELAIFSNELLAQDAYDRIVSDYIKDDLQITDYVTEEKEFGVIPMTTYDFKRHNTAKVFHIGTAGGAVKASSGYAFKRILEHNRSIIEALKNSKSIDSTYGVINGRFRYYDMIFLNAILNGNVEGAEVFTKLFQRLTPQEVFKFLDQETSFIEDLKIFTAPPFMPFLKSMFEVLLR